MNSLLYYYNNVQKMAAYRQAKRMQRGVRLGYTQRPSAPSTLKFTLGPIHIGTDDFSIEFWGNTYGSNSFYQPAVFFNNAGDGTFSISTMPAGTNGVEYVYFGRGISGDTAEDILYLDWVAPTQEGMFHCVVTRSGTLVKCFIEGEQKEQKTQTLLHDYGDVTIGIANSSNMGFVRVWNYALSADEIATLYNNGDPMGYVVPKAKRDGLLAEYLPQNLMFGRDDKTIATSWLDSAKQLPLSDEYMEPLFQSIGGYDMAANGAPEILYNE
uniref:LamG-like jellyroll fold domain-containing protein n=1 Tax=Alistipes megaguti TaxID=2364787 RepID=UPI000EFC3EE2|nr:LamG-like jellyroll fold domain-containing protein [Alistipes megaguti]